MNANCSYSRVGTRSDTATLWARYAFTSLIPRKREKGQSGPFVASAGYSDGSSVLDDESTVLEIPSLRNASALC